MLKDIKQTPDRLKALLNSYIQKNKEIINIKLSVNPEKLGKIYITASGSSRNAANTAKYVIEKIAGIPVIVDFAGEFANRSVAVNQNDLLIALSQSGETADVFAALKKTKKKGIPTFAITNNPDSGIHKLADSAMFIHAGEEKSIPATKSFTCQLMSLYILGLFLAEQRKFCPEPEINIIKEKLSAIPGKISENIGVFSEKANLIAGKIKDNTGLIILGRGQNSALAEEGALKIQETSYINTFGYPTSEFMHGHLAVLEEGFPVISILTEVFDDFSSNILAEKNTLEIKKKRNPFLITIARNTRFPEEEADIFIEINEPAPEIAPFLTAVFLQFLAYKLAVLLGRDTANPRSLSKTVTNE